MESQHGRVEETLKIIEPWSDGVDGLGGTLRIVEAWDHGMDGLGGALNLTELQLPATGCVDQHTHYFSEGKIRLVHCWQSLEAQHYVSAKASLFSLSLLHFSAVLLVFWALASSLCMAGCCCVPHRGREGRSGAGSDL